MAKFSLRRVEDQARASAFMSGLSVLPWLAMTFFILKKLVWGEYVLYYGPRGKAAVLICGALTLMLSAIGLGLGLSSVGQRRNDKPKLSWIGFLAGAAVLTLAVISLAMFFVRGEAIVQK